MEITQNQKNHLSISLTEGRIVRDLFNNGLLNQFTNKNYNVTVYSEASKASEFTSVFKTPNVNFSYLYPCSIDTARSRIYWMRRRFIKISSHRLINEYYKLEENLFYKPHPSYLDQLKSDRSKVVLTTHAHLADERELISAAHKLNIPTLGFIKSWDNIHKGIHSRTDKMAVWNNINKEELVETEKYPPENIFVTGPPQFDQYFKSNVLVDRNEYFSKIGLDQNRPTIFFATIGDFGFNIDESYWLDFLIDQINSGRIKGNPQIICRLHPWSRLELFEKYSAIPWIKISYINTHFPTIGWYMNKNDVKEMANMIGHSDLVISPGSTVLLESAIFNRPTLFPIFHDLQPERTSQYFNRWVLGKHFDRIRRMDLVPIIDKSNNFSSNVNKCLQNPNWYSEQRSQLVQDYVQFTDGDSTKRLAKVTIDIANSS